MSDGRIGFQSQEAMQEYVRMQEGLRETRRKLGQCVMRARNKKVERARIDMTLKTLSELDDSTVSYASVGKMYLLTPLKDLKTALKENDEREEKELNVLNNSIKYLDTQGTDIEKQMGELIKNQKGDN